MPSRVPSRMPSRRAVALATALAAVALAGCSGQGQTTSGQPGASATGGPAFAVLGQRAVRTLEQGYYTGTGG